MGQGEDQKSHSSVLMTSSFGGLAAQGINVRYSKSPGEITINRSPLELVVAGVGLFGLAAGPLYFIGIDQVRLALEGNFGGDRLFLLIFEIFVLVAIGLFVKSNILRRPVAVVSKRDQSIRYTHPGYYQLRIAAGDIAYLCVTKCRGISTSSDEGLRIYYAVTVHGKDENATNIATHVDAGKMATLANEVAAVLSVAVKN